MLTALAFIFCFAAITPVIGFAAFFGLVDRVATAPGSSGIARLGMQVLELLSTPWRFLSIVLFNLTLIVAGCVPSSRGWALVLVGLIGAICLVQVIRLARPKEFAEVIVLLPSLASTVTCLAWAFHIFASGTAAF